MKPPIKQHLPGLILEYSTYGCLVYLAVVITAFSMVVNDLSEQGTRAYAGWYGRMRVLEVTFMEFPDKTKPSIFSKEVWRMLQWSLMQIGALMGDRAADLMASGSCCSTRYENISPTLGEAYWALAIARGKCTLEEGVKELEQEVAGRPEILHNDLRFKRLMHFCERLHKSIDSDKIACAKSK